MVGPEPLPKATVHSFFPIQTFEAQIQMLPLISITEQQKQTESTYWPPTKRTIRLQMCSLFLSRCSAGIETLVKVSLRARADTWEEQLPVGALHLNSGHLSGEPTSRRQRGKVWWGHRGLFFRSAQKESAAGSIGKLPLSTQGKS